MVNIDVLVLVLLKLLLRYRLVITFTGLEIELADASSLSDWKLRVALRFADAATAVSNDIYTRIAARYPGARVQFLANGIDATRASRIAAARTVPGIDPDHFVFCGRLHVVKRVPQLVEVFRDCVEAGCDRNLYVVGDGPERQHVEELLRRYHMEDRVILVGELSHEMALGVIGSSRAVLLNSAHEAAPLVILEAMALGRPVIAPDVGGVGEMIRHGREGLLFDDGDTDGLGRAILRLAEDPAVATRLGAQARSAVTDRFDFALTADAYRDVYRGRALAGRNEPAA
jgi:glycosyltransferase involved in cell wall biosynthesis